jgi:hypothetical protein
MTNARCAKLRRPGRHDAGTPDQRKRGMRERFTRTAQRAAHLAVCRIVRWRARLARRLLNVRPLRCRTLVGARIGKRRHHANKELQA